MIMPSRHVAGLDELRRGAEGAAVWEGLRQAVMALRSAYRPDGLNVGANLEATPRAPAYRDTSTCTWFPDGAATPTSRPRWRAPGSYLSALPVSARKVRDAWGGL